MPDEYKRNHYVPEWYQKRFIPPEQRNKELYLLNLKPGTFVDQRGVQHHRKPIKRLGPKFCFFEEDLYNLKTGPTTSTEVERLFFGSIDANGRKAVEHFSDFHHLKSGTHDAFAHLMLYLSTQKLRTPKGLGWLQVYLNTSKKELLMRGLVELRQLHCAIWTECVWQIAAAEGSETKFIISDHPVTVYNRVCGPRSQWCRQFSDPPIWAAATHTIFPLSLEKVLILTNLSWVRNPYQSEMKIRPNPSPFRDAMFSLLDIQTGRILSEKEVRQINFIIKSRALRFVASCKEEWLHPEEFVTKSEWTRFGNGYLLMPDPRSVGFKGELLIGYSDGRSTAFDEYGRRPWQSSYGSGSKYQNEKYTFDRFQGEFARLFGPSRRGRTYNLGALDPEVDSQGLHSYHLSLEKPRRKCP